MIRSFRTTAALLVGALLVAACQAPGTGTPAPTTAPTGAADGSNSTCCNASAEHKACEQCPIRLPADVADLPLF